MNGVMNKTHLQKKKQYELNKRRKLIRKQIEANKEVKQNEKRRNRDNMVEDNALGWFFELATTSKIYVNSLILHEIKNEMLSDYSGDFELYGSMLIGKKE